MTAKTKGLVGIAAGALFWGIFLWVRGREITLLAALPLEVLRLGFCCTSGICTALRYCLSSAGGSWKLALIALVVPVISANEWMLGVVLFLLLISIAVATAYGYRGL